MQDVRTQVFMDMVVEQLVLVRPDIDPRTVGPASRLTGDLALDSIQLYELFERIKDQGSPDITAWVAEAANGDDSVGTLVDHLLRNAEPALGGTR